MNTVTRHIQRILIIFLTCLVLGSAESDAQTSKASQKQKTSTSQTANSSKGKNGGAKSSKTSSTKKKSGAKTSGQAGKKQNSPKPQTSQSLQKEQKNVKAEIAKTQKQIEENKQSTLKQLNSLDQLKGEITTTTNNINSLTREVQTIEAQEKVAADSITMLDARVERLRQEAARSLRDNRKNRRSLSELNLIFSAPTFYQALKRSGRIRQANERVVTLSQELQETIGLLDAQKQQLNQLRQMHSDKLADLSKENATLLSKQKETQTVVANLKKEGNALKQALLEKQKRAKALDDEITRLIAEEKRQAEEARKKEEARKREEARKAEEKRKQEQQRKNETAKTDNAPAAKPAAGTEKPATGAAAATSNLTGTFASNKGKLLFPVTGKYNIVSYFGRNQHEELPNVEIDNSGIDILTPQGASARAVYDGVVSMIVNLGGSHNVVMVRHGEYITVYSNIQTAAVKKGQSVKAGQTIGTIYTDAADNNRTILHFEVRKETQKLNPLQWVKR